MFSIPHPFHCSTYSSTQNFSVLLKIFLSVFFTVYTFVSACIHHAPNHYIRIIRIQATDIYKKLFLPLFSIHTGRYVLSHIIKIYIYYTLLPHFLIPIKIYRIFFRGHFRFLFDYSVQNDSKG